MEPYCNGIAQIRHATTGIVYEIEADELEWEQNGGDERGMGPETRYEAIVDHPQLGTLTWALWEYPVGAENRDDTDVGEHVVVKNFDFGLQHVRDDYDEDDSWLNVDIPDEPLDIFQGSFHLAGELLANHGGDSGNHLMNRMVFAHHLTAMEAYLGDTLIGGTLGNPEALERIMKNAKDLKDERFTLAQIAATPDIVTNKVQEHLRGIMYHNLKKVDALYDIAFQFRILPLMDDRPALFDAVMLRHDCVHRNGFDKDGKELTVFTKQFVQETADKIKAFVIKVEQKVQEVSAQRWLEGEQEVVRQMAATGQIAPQGNSEP
jgi:hypothetical protein